MKTPRPVLALIAVALVIAACGGEATSPTPVETPLSAKLTLEIPSLGLQIPFDGEIKLK